MVTSSLGHRVATLSNQGWGLPTVSLGLTSGLSGVPSGVALDSVPPHSQRVLVWSGCGEVGQRTLPLAGAFVVGGMPGSDPSPSLFTVSGV